MAAVPLLRACRPVQPRSLHRQAVRRLRRHRPQRQHQGHQDRDLRPEELLGLRQDLHRRRHHRLGRDAQGRRQGLRRRRAGGRRLPDRPGPAPRRPSTGRRSTAAPSIAAARSRPRSPAASTRRSGTSRARCYGVPVYKLLGGPTRDRIRVYGTRRAKRPASTP